MYIGYWTLNKHYYYYYSPCLSVRLSRYPMLWVPSLHVLLFVLHVYMLRECDGDGNAGVGSRGGVVAMSAYMGGTHGSGV